MFKSQKHVFWQALIVTIAIFSIGIFLGIILENWRTSNVDLLYLNSEIDLLDIRLQGEIYSGEDFSCDVAIEENIKFADRVYEEAIVLDRYEDASELTGEMLTQHKKYDILRAMLLLNSIKVKERCNASYYNLVYFYEYGSEDQDQRIKQNMFSKILAEVKEQKGDKVLLIPMAANNNVSSISLIIDRMGISEDELPVIMVGDKKKITELETVDEIIRYIE